MLRGLLRSARASARAAHRAHFSSGPAAPDSGPSVVNDTLEFVVQAAKVAGLVYVLDTYVFNLSSVRGTPRVVRPLRTSRACNTRNCQPRQSRRTSPARPTPAPLSLSLRARRRRAPA